MVKKLIAGALSGTLFLSAVMTEGLFSIPDIGQQIRTTTEEKKDDSPNITSSNSLGNYIARASAESEKNHDVNAQTLASTQEEKYEITNLEFDAGNGQLRAASSQTSACVMIFSFIDEEKGTVIQSIRQKVEKSEKDNVSVITQAKADISVLPEFFIVQAQLVDESGTALSKPYKLNDYTKQMREIAATDINDFEESQVVNFDESEDTNFIVLNEETVKAESSEDVNTLVSADYDTNIYVIDNIDDSILNLQSGQYFYMQPNEEDVIAVAVEDVQIDGDTASIKGNDEIGGMFDFIKIENVSTTEDAQLDTSEAGEDVEYLEDESEDGSSLNFRIDNASKKGISGSKGWNFTESFGPEFKSPNEHFRGKAAITVSIKSEFNFYKSWGYSYVKSVWEQNIKLSVTGTATTDGKDGSLGLKAFKPIEDEELKEKLGKVTIATPIPGLGVDLQLNLVFRASASYTFSGSRTITKGFIYDSDYDDVEKIGVDNDWTDVTQKLEGKIFFGIEFKLGLSYIKVVSIGLTATIGLEATGNVNIVVKCNNKNGELHTTGNVFCCYDSTGIWTHACDECIEGDIQFVAKVGVYFSLGVKPLKYEVNFDFKTFKCKICDWYCSWLDGKFTSGWGKCPNLAYKTEFNFPLNCGENVVSTGSPYIEVEVDGEEFVAYNNKLEIYSMPNKTHYYKVYVNGELKTTGSYTQIPAKKTLNIPFTFSADKEGNISVSADSKTGSDGEKHVTTVATTVKKVITTMTTVATKPDYSNDEYIELGPNINAMFYGDGSVWIYGYGDMYDFNSSPFIHPENIKCVEMQDEDPDNGKVITGIGNNVFSGAKNLQAVYTSNSIKRIGNHAFYNCSSLAQFRYGGKDDKTTTFVLPSALTNIGNYAFYNCSSANFGSLTVPAGVTNIGNYAFAGCAKLTSVSTQKNLKTVGESAFNGCSALKSAVIGSNVTSIGTRVFSDCIALQSLTLPYAGLSEDYISKNSYALVYYMFNYYAPKGTYSVTGNSYNGVPATLTEITITGGKTVPNEAFYGMSSLKTVKLPETITSIGNSSFKGCSNLVNVNLPSKLVTIGNNAFQNCGLAAFNATTMPSTVTSIGSYSFAGCVKITSLTVPGNVKSIGTGAFSGCTGIKTAVLQTGVTSIGQRVFENCTSLQSLTLPFAGLSEENIAKDSYALPYYLFNYYAPDGTYSVTGNSYNGVPETLTEITVLGGNRIPNEAFYGMKKLKKINISESITSIGNSAFYNCSSMVSAKLPSKLTSIGNSAFYNCGFAEFNETTIPSKVETIGNSAFANCKKLTSIVIPGNVNTIGNSAFSGCTGLTKAVINKGVKSIGQRAFESCTSLQSLTLPFAGLSEETIESDSYALVYYLFNYYAPDDTYSVTGNSYNGVPATLTEIEILGGSKIPNEAFYGMKNLETIIIPDTIKSIGNSAFYNCNNMVSAKLPETLTTIGNSAFVNCGLAEFNDTTIPENVTYIGNSAFANCLKLTSVEVPGNVKTIGSNVFSGCTNLKSAVISEGVTSIGQRAFESCTSLESLTLPFAGLSEEYIAKDSYALPYYLFNYYAPDGTYSVTGNAYNGVPEKLTEITILGGDKIPNEAFYGMKKLQKINLPDTILSIGNSAFENCSSYVNVKLPAGLTSIGNSAFKNCGVAAFNETTIPSTVTSIGNSAFANCVKLSSVTIPGNVKTIGSSVFSGCTGLTKAVLNTGIKTIGQRAFENCTSLQSLTLPFAGLSEENIESDSYALVYYLFNYYAPEGTYSVTGNSYNGVPSSLTEITILGGNKIPNEAFYGMKKLKTITIPDSVTSIGNSSFENCSAMVSANLPAKLTKIGNSAFKNCGLAAFNETTIPSTVTSIGNYAFAGCNKLTSITVPGTVKTLGTGIFSGCTNLKSAVISEGVTSIGQRAFESCTSLESLTLPFAGLSEENITKDSYALPYYLFNYYAPDGTYSVTGNSYNGVPKTLTKITILGGEKIPNEAFYGMKNVKTFVLPSTLTSVGNSAFNGCTGFEKLYILGGKVDWKKVNIGKNNDPLLLLINTEEYIQTTTTTSTTSTTTTTAKTTTTTTKATTTTSTTTKKPTTTTTTKATTTTKKPTTTTTTKATTTTTTTKATTTTTTTKATTTTTTKATTTTKKPTTTTTTKITTTTKAPATTTTVTEIVDITTTTSERVLVQKIKLGDSITATVYNDGSAFIAGDGEMYDFDATPFETPENITKVVMRDPDPENDMMITSIGANLFNGATALRDIYISGNIRKIGGSAFEGAESLDNVTIPATLEAIGDGAFRGCTGITEAGYAGSEDQWKAVSIGIDNESLTEKIRFNAEMREAPKNNGDSNGDGQLSKADGMMLARYLAGWDGVVIILMSGDINGDGQITKADGMILARYLAGWEGYDNYFN